MDTYDEEHLFTARDLSGFAEQINEFARRLSAMGDSVLMVGFTNVRHPSVDSVVSDWAAVLDTATVEDFHVAP